jgi:hypothetical protein
MTEEQESDKKLSGGPGITAGGNVHISGVSGQVAIGKDITQTQIISQTDLKDLLHSLHEFKKGVPKLDLTPEDQNIVNGEISVAIKEAKKDKPAPSKIKERFKSIISTIKAAGKSIKDISELHEPAKKIATILGIGLQALL